MAWRSWPRAMATPGPASWGCGPWSTSSRPCASSSTSPCRPGRKAPASCSRHPTPTGGLATAYTTLDTPALVDRIRHDLAEVVAAVRGADPGLRALILTGGFARGEGTVLDGVPQ